MRLPIGDGMTVDKESFFKAAQYLFPCLWCPLYFAKILYASCRTSLTERILMWGFGKELWALYYYTIGLSKTSVPYSSSIQSFNFMCGVLLREVSWKKTTEAENSSGGADQSSRLANVFLCWLLLTKAGIDADWLIININSFQIENGKTQASQSQQK